MNREEIDEIIQDKTLELKTKQEEAYKELYQVNQRHEDTIQQLKDETIEKIKKLEVDSVLFTHLSVLQTLSSHECLKDLLKL
jgi:hypothetical protein